MDIMIMAVISLSFSAVNFIIGISVVIKILKIAKISKMLTIVSIKSLLIMCVGCVLYSLAIYNELPAVYDYENEDHIKMLYVLIPVTFIGRFLITSELTVFPFKLIYSIDNSFLIIPCNCLLKKIMLKQWYYIYYGASLLVIILVICLGEATIIFSKQVLVYIQQGTFLPYLLYNSIYQIIGAAQLVKKMKIVVNMVQSKQKSDIVLKERRITQHTQHALVLLVACQTFLSVVANIFVIYRNVMQCSTECNYIQQLQFASQILIKLATTAIMACSMILVTSIKRLLSNVFENICDGNRFV